ncbi:Plasma membrane sulfite pump involved in sulfite metabolism [Neophaeococcomyces mojaviensis]|uniref:Plasma membrane sulfite pump involved in sulfite metabolism n=1 Tax=Neophaeococcomyces mojaviensis TaxID=3383035 RepID=A0ACC3A5F2_9EURO|nr:Plasma membrane sulfite pump involved in sulfite metabolism [Knufia sp. JES_112]
MDPAGSSTICQSSNQDIRPVACNQFTPANHYNNMEDQEKYLRSKNNRGFRRIILNFTPSWFAITMGTGITSILLHNLPYNARWLYYLSIIIFCLNVLLFSTFLTISILRYIMFPGIFTTMLKHPVQSLFLGTFPMGLATLINMIVFVCVPAWGHGAVTLAWTLWWINVVLSLTTALYLPFTIINVHHNELSNMTAIWLLPIVAPIVAAASGGIVAEVLSDPQHALWTVITSYVLLGTGFPLAMMLLTMYFHRLTIHHLPPREVIVSVFLPLGPLGQGSFALMQLGKCALKIFPKVNAFPFLANNNNNVEIGAVFFAVGHLVGLVIWGFGLVWLFFALASISRSKFPFNMGWWGFTFPLGVYAVSTCAIAQDLPSDFLKVIGTGLSVAVVLLWVGVGFETARRAVRGEIFFAPCVQAYEVERAARRVEKERQQSRGERDAVE